MNAEPYILRLTSNIDLAFQLARRELNASHKGALLGWAWQFLSPLLMLGVYTLVFTKILQLRWVGNADPAIYSLNIFAGMVVFTIFSDCAIKSATLVLLNPNYVKKIKFPLDVLCASGLLVSLYRAFAGLIILLLFRFAILGGLPFSCLLLPFAWLPYIIFLLAFMLVIAGFGVYIRDLPNLMQLLTTLLNFVSGVFFPISSLPEGIKSILGLNPIMNWIQSTRSVVIAGTLPSPSLIIVQIIVSLILLEVALRVFKKLSNGFADVI
jgi:lipopolysaccharide transport system permease protein